LDVGVFSADSDAAGAADTFGGLFTLVAEHLRSPFWGCCCEP
jgi:hypothetical protein